MLSKINGFMHECDGFGVCVCLLEYCCNQMSDPSICVCVCVCVRARVCVCVCVYVCAYACAYNPSGVFVFCFYFVFALISVSFYGNVADSRCVKLHRLTSSHGRRLGHKRTTEQQWLDPYNEVEANRGDDPRCSRSPAVCSRPRVSVKRGATQTRRVRRLFTRCPRGISF